MTTTDPNKTGKNVDQRERAQASESSAKKTERDLHAMEVLTARADVDADGHVRFGFQFSTEVY